MVNFFYNERNGERIEAVYIYNDSDNFEVGPETDQMKANYQTMIMYLMNNERQKNGLNSLVWSDEAEQAAIRHSMDMAKNENYGHIDSDGSTPYSRMTDAGINGYYYGECLAVRQNDPFNSFYFLVYSPINYDIVLDSVYEQVGVGLYVDVNTEYKYSVTVDLFGDK